MEFSRQEYWNGLPFPSPGDLPNPGIEPKSPALQADALVWGRGKLSDAKSQFIRKTLMLGKFEGRSRRGQQRMRWLDGITDSMELSLKNGSLYSAQLEKEMATHSSTLAWKIPWMEEPGRLQSMGSLRIRHD